MSETVNYYENFKEIEKKIWSLLTIAVKDRSSEFRTPVFICGNDKDLDGRVVVLRKADELSFADIEKNIKKLSDKAKDGKLTIEDLQGGTFTISNGGVYGSMLSTPILNLPQSGVLGMHNIVDRPIVVDGEIKIRPVMYLALSYDHRIIDGKDSVSFLKTIKENLEDPRRLFLNI